MNQGDYFLSNPNVSKRKLQREETMLHVFLFCIWSTLLRMSEGYYTQQWVVHVPGGEAIAESLAKDHGFVNLGEVCI